MITHNSYYEKFTDGTIRCIDDEIPFELPQGWIFTRLGVIGDWGSGSTPAKGNPEYYGGDTLWLRTGELNNSTVFNTEIKITEKALKECSFRLNQPGDILIAMYGATIGKVAIAGKEMTTNQACCGCTPFGVFNKYLFYFLMANQPIFVKQGEGGAQPNISREKIVAFLFPMPPYNEQVKIVERIENVLPHIEVYGNSQNNLNELNTAIMGLLRKSILQEAIQGRLVPQNPNDEPASVLLERIKTEKARLIKEKRIKKDKAESVIFKGDDNCYFEKLSDGTCIDIDESIPFDIPQNWQWCRLGHIAQLLIGKTPPRGEHQYWSNGIYYWISISDMADYGRITTTKEKVSQFAADSSFGRISKKGSLIMSFKLTVGRTSILDIDAYHNEAIITIVNYIDKNNTLRDYLFWVLPLLSVLGDSKDAIKGKTLNSKSLYNLLIPLPPIAEQERIVNRFKELYKILT